MSRNGSGIYSLPAGSAAVDGAIIDPVVFNTLISDLESDANTARPIVAGGTGATTAAAARTNLGATAVGASVFTAADAAAARSAIGAATTPTTSAGLGQWTRVTSASSGAACTLPAGGTWAYFLVATNASTGAVVLFAASVVAGGTNVYQNVGDVGNALCWRIS